jgi:formate dehydrogenase major subunit
MPRLTIDGRAVECAEGGTLLEAIRRAGSDVPALCHDPRVKPMGGCRLCLVQIKGWPKPVTACNTPAADGMTVQTRRPELENCRRTILRLLARQYPRDGEPRDSQFQQYLRAYQVEEELGAGVHPWEADDSHPYIQTDTSRCILCYRCVRVCDEVQGQFVWQAWNRGDATRIRAGSAASLAQSACVGCGTCVDACPAGALADKRPAAAPPTEWTRTTCPYCGTGCEMHVGTFDGRIVSVRPAIDALVNKGHLCVKGRYAFAFNDSPDRVTHPLIRRGDQWKDASWNDAISHVADGLRRVIDRHGPDAVGVLGSARATNEENYLTQKFARVVLGTNNVDCCARVCHAPTATGMKAVLGAGAATNSFDDIEEAQAILVCGANPTENHPIVGARIKQAAMRGAALIVIDPRRIELSQYADCQLPVRPGSNVALLNAMAYTIVEEGLHDSEFIRARVAEWNQFREFVAGYRPEAVEAECGVGADLIRRAARLYATRKPAMCFHGLGVTEHVQGTDGVMCLVNLALLTGNLGKAGCGVNPLRGQNNVQGAAHMGCEPANLTGYVPLEAGGELFESVWQAPVPRRPGLNLMQMIDAANSGRLKALWAIGYDIGLTNPNASETLRALRSLDLLVVQDLFLNVTAESASVFLPAASCFEKDGTYMNAERRVQRVRTALPPKGSSRPDWQIICDVARAMGHGERFAFKSAQEVWDEVRAVWPAGRGITYERLEFGGLQWPCPTPEHPGTAVLHGGSFAGGQRAALRRVVFTASPEVRSEEFPFLLMTGRTLYQFNAGTMTLCTRNSTRRPQDCLDISPSDAHRLGVADGARVRVSSRYGEAVLPARINPAMKPHELFETFHTIDAFLNHLTSSRRDRRTDTPEYKVTAVRVDRA